MSATRGKKPHTGTSNIPKPTGLVATVVPPDKVYLSWNLVLNAQGYWIYRNGYVPAVVQATSYIDIVGGPATYTYQIAAVVDTVLGPKSDPVSVIVT